MLVLLVSEYKTFSSIQQNTLISVIFSDSTLFALTIPPSDEIILNSSQPYADIAYLQKKISSSRHNSERNQHGLTDSWYS